MSLTDHVHDHDHSHEAAPVRRVQAVVFDWAGTIIDFGSHAPMGTFVELFANEGVEISIVEARVPMGMPKWQHIEALGALPGVTERWLAAKGSAMTVADIDRLYDLFTPMNAASVVNHSVMIPGAIEVINSLRGVGVKTGTTTGYNRAIADVMLPLAEAQGFVPDSLLCAGDLPITRPTPLGMYRAMIDLGVWPASTVIKVDDTVPGLMEGRHAGCWTVGVLISGNAVGLTVEGWAGLDDAERQRLRSEASTTLEVATPDYLIDSVADLLGVVDHINQRLAAGERPIPPL
jgi:phosphonoacetaldehyde hydrolase